MKRPVILLIAAILGIALCVYTWSYMHGSMSRVSGMQSAEAVGTSIGVALATPHAVLATLATVFCCLGWLFKLRWSALVAGILYAVSMVLMLPWFYLVLVQMILCFIGYSRMKKA